MKLLLLVAVVSVGLLTQAQARPKVERHPHRLLDVPEGWRLHEYQAHWLLASRDFAWHGQKEYFAQLKVSAPAEAVLGLLQETDKMAEWVHHGQSARLLAELGPGHYRVESRYDPPWPIRHRDLITESYQWRKGDQLWLEIKATPDAHPNQQGYVRIEQMESCWLALPRQGGSTLFYLGHLQDPGYSPNLIINSAMTLSFSQTLRNLQARLSGNSPATLPMGSAPPEDWRYCKTLEQMITLSWPALLNP